jgi:hypothetical protein
MCGATLIVQLLLIALGGGLLVGSCGPARPRRRAGLRVALRVEIVAKRLVEHLERAAFVVMGR